jgi:DNA repair exonuclease SbcCD ATPase subunit
MNTIQIETKGTDFETITISLDQNQVAALYEQSKENINKIKELEKNLKDKENSLKYSEERYNTVNQEANDAHTLMTALGIKTQNDETESWNRRELKLSTRIALYIAANK